jgi:hypothetical protein
MIGDAAVHPYQRRADRALRDSGTLPLGRAEEKSGASEAHPVSEFDGCDVAG